MARAPRVSETVLLAVLAQRFLNPFHRVQKTADGNVVVQMVDDKGDIFAQITVDVVRACESSGSW